MRKQLDPRIPVLINNNVKKNYRSFIVLVGDKGRDQVSSLVRYSRINGAKTFFLKPDCKPTLFALASSSVRAAFSTMVLQERIGVHEPS